MVNKTGGLNRNEHLSDRDYSLCILQAFKAIQVGEKYHFQNFMIKKVPFPGNIST